MSMFRMFSRGKRDKPRPAVVLGCAIQDFFVMRGVLFVRGVVERRGEKGLPRASVRLRDGSLHPVRLEKDPFVPTIEAHWAFSFSHTLPPGTPTGDIGRISVVFDFPDDRFEMTDVTAGGHARDEFLNSEKGFWDAVRGNPAANVLEIGSRARSGINRRNLFPEACNYVGLDIAAGENVSVVGDAHALSSLFPAEHFDFVFSVSVWEHLAMPWKVSIELNRVMRTGGLAMINTHQSWPVHEEPWDYFRFSDFAWDTLFNAATGFEIVARGMGSKCVMAPSLFSPPLHDCQVEWHYGCLATRVVVRKVGATSLSWPVDPASVTRGKYSH
jgi:SAM-dependent methyltransferase